MLAQLVRALPLFQVRRPALKMALDNSWNGVTDESVRLQALALPSAPAPSLEPAAVAFALCRGLQLNDVPHVDAGLERLFRFATYECRAALTARKVLPGMCASQLTSHRPS